MTAPDPAPPDPAFAPLALAAAGARPGALGGRAAVLPYGAHVVSWQPDAGGPDRLFVSARADYRAGAAIRGGVPVIFPQFGDRVPGPDPSIRHGFARTRPWRVASAAPDAVVLALADDATTRARWPHAFRAELTVRCGDGVLSLELAVENTGDALFAFTGALHTYLRVGDAATARVTGLESAAGLDQAAGGAALAPLRAPLGFGAEVDHLYPGAGVPGVGRGPIVLDDPALGRATRVAQTGWPDVVVWNPGPARGAALADLEQPGGWRHFVCVEAVAADPVAVAPGGRWRGAQQLTAG